VIHASVARSRPAPSPQGGFSLLEALVALVVVAGVGMTVYGWINTNLISLERARAPLHRGAAIDAAMTVIGGINPMKTPKGQRDHGPYTIAWDSSTVEPVRPGVTRSGRPGVYRVGLYRCRIRVTRPGYEPVSFDVRRTGYQQVRSAQ